VCFFLLHNYDGSDRRVPVRIDAEKQVRHSFLPDDHWRGGHPTMDELLKFNEIAEARAARL
jgi:hypothetical protein